MYFLNDTSQTPGPGDGAPEPAPGGFLTYEPFYGLREKPFSLSADPRFLFRSPAHGPAFDALLAGIRRREGLIVLTGEIGTGKTTLCRSVLQHLDRRTVAAFVPDPFVSREDLLKTLLVDFGVIAIGDLAGGRFSGASRSDLSYPLYEFLDSLVPLQAFAVVIIDEAQNLSLPLLEEIRILSELERREKLLQVVLVGQPELRASLKLPQMRQVDQRVSLRCELSALDAAAVVGYVKHRLDVAGLGKNRVEFSEQAFDALYQGSSGVPRLINRICDRALQCASAAGSVRVEAPFVWDAINDLGLTPVAVTPEQSANPQAAVPANVDEALPQLPVDVAAPVVIVNPPSAEPIVDAPAPRLIVETPQPVPAVDVVIKAGADADLSQFAEESAVASAPHSRWVWVTVAASAVLAVTGIAGGAAWQRQARLIEDVALAGLLPPPRPPTVEPAIVLPVMEPTVPDLPPQATTVSSPAAEAPKAGAYSIVVASFESPARAERLVEELASAGYRAQTVELDAGPARPHVHQVTVGGFGSAIEVERALQHIRELPGRYTDAKIVER